MKIIRCIIYNARNGREIRYMDFPNIEYADAEGEAKRYGEESRKHNPRNIDFDLVDLDIPIDDVYRMSTIPKIKSNE